MIDQKIYLFLEFFYLKVDSLERDEEGEFMILSIKFKVKNKCPINF